MAMLIWQNAFNVEAYLKEVAPWKWGAHKKPFQRDMEVETGSLVLGPAWSRAGLVLGRLGPWPSLVPGQAGSRLGPGPWSLAWLGSRPGLLPRPAWS